MAWRFPAVAEQLQAPDDNLRNEEGARAERLVASRSIGGRSAATRRATRVGRFEPA
jgi:hypothetical protein